MTLKPPTQDVRQMGAVVYTPSARTTGHLRTIHWRLSDTLNAVDQEFVLIHDAVIQSLHATAGEELNTGWSLVRKDSIVVAQIDESFAGQELPPARQALVADRVQVKAKIEAWPFIIDGMLHLPPNADLLQHIHDPHRQFMPVTDANVTYQPSPLLSFKAPFLLVNRARVEVVIDASQLGLAAHVDPEVVAASVVDTDLSGARAAELLAGTSVFKVVDFPQLVALCEELCKRRRMSRKLVDSGADVFAQGDKGDSMYVVESGTLQVVFFNPVANEVHELAELGPGEIFGEMAILGEGRRTATIHAKERSRLMAIHEEAVQALIHQFPAASTRLLTLILARRGGLDAVQRSIAAR